ncbi:MAG TPA: hypothetical protein VE978_16255 [Chitinophagales bacterium]|nr:hypothetical protein [Chitinophagales bacterium]
MQKIGKPRRGRNNIYFGAFLGLIFPAAGFLLFWIFRFSDHLSLQEYWNSLFSSGTMSGALSLSIILNLGVFFYHLSNNNYSTVKGVIGATIFYGVLIIIFKLL